jgi:FtsZ-binding cell division protein ZapB
MKRGIGLGGLSLLGSIVQRASRPLILCKPCFGTLFRMPNQSATNLHPLVRISPTPQSANASDPLPVMRREMKLLLIELQLLRVEVEQLRAMEDQARRTREFLSAYVNRIMESRDQWQREAERLSALISRVPQWLLFWARGSKQLRKLDYFPAQN